MKILCLRGWHWRSILLLLLLYPTMVCASQEKITVKGQSVTLRQVIRIIEKNSDYTFFFKANDVDGQVAKNLNCEGTVQEVLDVALKGTSLKYVIKNNQILLVPSKTEEKKTESQSTQQKKQRVITGTIISGEDNQPIIGANVWLKNSAIGTITDMDGKYTIKVEGLGGVLTFSYIGMKPQEVLINDQRNINITLMPDTEVLDEVVVVGYGNQKKESVVGAISTLDMTKLKVPGSSISNVLAGQLAGVVAISRSGEPGKASAAEFFIRGVSSFKGSATPLVLVDGIERELDLVDTDDIASFSILKDASASAVYGVRGANGVIIITTKKGSEGRPKINARAEFGVTSPTKMVDFVNSAQWAELYNEAKGMEYYTPDDIRKYRDGSDPDLFPNVNWADELYRNTATNQRVNLSISGGGDICKYYVSGSFYNEGSIFKNVQDKYDYNSSINYNKFNFRANMDFSLTRSTVLNINLANIYEKAFAPGAKKSDIWGYTFSTSPNAFPVEYSNGKLSSPSANSGNNPWNLLVHSGYQEQFWNSAQSLIGLTQDLGDLVTKGLTANVKFSWDAFNTSTQKRTKNPTRYHAQGRDPETGELIMGSPVATGSDELAYSRESEAKMTTYLEASLNYNRVFAQKHRVGVLFLYNHKLLRKLQDSDKFKSLPYKNQGIAGRVTYAFKDTYMGEFNMGYNGSENFAPGHRFGFFPAVAVGWVVSNESWFEPAVKVVDFLKFKFSHGLVGNDQIGNDSRRWIYEPTIVSGASWGYGATGNNGGTSSLRIGEVENLNVSWEEARKTNVGVEFSLFGKLKVQADYFYEKRTGIFIQREGLPDIAGVSSKPYVNLGSTLNRGFDGSMEYAQQVGQVFLTARANFTYNRNKVLDNDQPAKEYAYQEYIGKSFGKNSSYQPFGLVALGLFQSQEEIDESPVQTFGEYRVGDVKYQDINGDGKIDTYDRVALGYTNLPEMIYGFGVTAQWKDWDINVFFQGVGHASIFTSGGTMRPFTSGNLERSAINADLYDKVWKTTNTPEQNANAIYPRLSMQNGPGSSNNNQTSTLTMNNGRFLRLKNFEMGYTLPKSILNRTFIKSLRFYVSGNNLLTFSKFKLWDPEKGGGDGSGYPPLRVVSFGLNANF